MILSDSPIQFPDNLKAAEDLSASAVLSPNHILIGGDEGHAVEVLKLNSDNVFTLEQTLILVEDKEEDEVDIEDICCLDDTCYVIGSHSRKRKKLKPELSYKENRKRLFKAPKPEPTRAVLFQLKIDRETYQIQVKKQRSLEEIIAGDELLEQFIRIPSKENGIDIEGLAIRDKQLFVGFRSPVLRGNYVPVLVLNPRKFRKYELRFIQMGGRGIRAMTETQDGFLVLGGPPGDGEGTYDIYFWDGADMIPGDDMDPIAPRPKLTTVTPPANSKSEGIALICESQDSFKALVVFDGIKGGNPLCITIPKHRLSLR